MSVNPTPPFTSSSRLGFVTADGASFIPGVDTFDSDGITNSQQLGGWSDAIQTVTLSGINPPAGQLAFSQDVYAFTSTGIGATVFLPGPWADPFVATQAGTEATTAKFSAYVIQDANGNQWQQGAGTKYENDLFEQTFTATVVNPSGVLDEWSWSPGTSNTTPVEVTVSAPSVDWSMHPNYSATVEATGGPSQVTLWDGTFNYVYRLGWFDPNVPYWYADSATVTIRRYIGKGATPPSYSEPGEYVPQNDNVAFKPIEFDPPNKAYT